MTQDSVMLHVAFIAQVVTVQTKTCRFFRSCVVSVTIICLTELTYYCIEDGEIFISFYQLTSFV